MQLGSSPELGFKLEARSTRVGVRSRIEGAA